MLFANAGRSAVQLFLSSVNTLKGRIGDFRKNLFSHSAALIVGCSVLALTAFLVSTTDKIIVGPFSVPEEYQKRGYTSEAVSSAVVQFIHGNESTVSFAQSTETPSPDNVDGIENLADYVDGKHVVSSFEPSSIPNINVPLTSYSLESLVGLLRQTMGRRPTQISGEVVALNEADSSTAITPDLQHAKMLIRYTIEYPEPSYSILGFHWWSRRTNTISDTLQANGAEEVVRKLALVTAEGLARRTLPDEDDRSRARRFISRGNVYFGLGDYDRAARMYKRANDFQESGHAYLCLGAIQELKHNFDKAEKLYYDATNTSNVDEDDDVRWALLYWGNLLLRENKLEEAKSKYVLVTAAPRTFNTLLVQAAAFNNIAFIDLHKKKFALAQKGFAYAQDFAEKLRTDAQNCQNSRCTNANGPSSSEAEDGLNITLANQLLARIHYGRARLMAMNCPDEVAAQMSEYQASIEANAAYSRAHYQLAKSYRAESDYKNALDELQKTIELEPGFAPAYSEWRSVINAWKNQPERQKTFKPRKRTLAADYKSWGDTFAQAGNPDDANERYCNAATLDPKFKSLCPDRTIASEN